MNFIPCGSGSLKNSPIVRLIESALGKPIASHKKSQIIIAAHIRAAWIFLLKVSLNCARGRLQAQNNGVPPAEREGKILRELLRGGRPVEKERLLIFQLSLISTEWVREREKRETGTHSIFHRSAHEGEAGSSHPLVVQEYFQVLCQYHYLQTAKALSYT